MLRKGRDKVHPYVPEIAEKLRKGEVSRREFLGTVTRLGVSVAAAYAMLGSITGELVAPRAQAATPKTGGNLRVSMNVMESSDPAIYDWSEKGNLARHMAEPLSRIGEDGVAPALSCGKLGGLGRPQDVDLPPAQGREVDERR